MTEDDYSKYYNKGNDCDCCKNQYWVKEDVLSCRKFDDGKTCDYEKCEG